MEISLKKKPKHKTKRLFIKANFKTLDLLCLPLQSYCPKLCPFSASFMPFKPYLKIMQPRLLIFTNITPNSTIRDTLCFVYHSHSNKLNFTSSTDFSGGLLEGQHDQQNLFQGLKIKSHFFFFFIFSTS